MLLLDAPFLNALERGWTSGWSLPVRKTLLNTLPPPQATNRKLNTLIFYPAQSLLKTNTYSDSLSFTKNSNCCCLYPVDANCRLDYRYLNIDRRFSFRTWLKIVYNGLRAFADVVKVLIPTVFVRPRGGIVSCIVFRLRTVCGTSVEDFCAESFVLTFCSLLFQKNGKVVRFV